MGQPTGAAGRKLSELDLPVGAGTNTARLSAALRGKGTVTLAGVKSREAGRPGRQAGATLRICHQESECNWCHSWDPRTFQERECEVKAQVGRMNSREEEV